AVVHVVSFRIADNIVEALGQNAVQLFVDDRFLPEIALTVLNPLEVRSRHAAGVGQDVRDDEDALVGEHLVGDRGSGSIGAFTDDTRLNALGIAAGDHVFGRRGDQDFALRREHFDRIVGLGPFKPQDRAVALAILDQRANVNAIGVEEAPIVFGDANDLVALVLHELGRIGSDIPEALNNHPASVAPHVQVLEGLIADHADAAARGLATASRSAN